MRRTFAWKAVTRFLVMIMLIAISGPLVAAEQPAEKSTSCEQMMTMRTEMMKSMKAMDQRLSSLVEEMDQAKGDDRIDAIAAVVRELVDQRSKMRGRMMKMQSKMMAHMRDHMHSGSAEQAGDCPAMKQMMDEGGK